MVRNIIFTIQKIFLDFFHQYFIPLRESTQNKVSAEKVTFNVCNILSIVGSIGTLTSQDIEKQKNIIASLGRLTVIYHNQSNIVSSQKYPKPRNIPLYG